MNTLTVLGYSVELLGFACAAVGLIQTWREHANGRPFLPPRLNCVWSWTKHKVFRRRRDAIVGVASINVSAMVGQAIGRTHRPLTDDMSVDDRIAALNYNIEKAVDLAMQALQRVSDEKTGRQADVKEPRSAIDDTRSELTRQDSDLAARGIPLAAAGLVLATLGLALQAVGSIAA